MKLLLAGACGFVGSTLARPWTEAHGAHQISGVDNFARPGSETNRLELQRRGVRVLHADVRSASDFEGLAAADVLMDAAANPSVLAGVDGRMSPRQLLEHNLLGTINMLEYCRRHRAGFILLSTSRVYSLPPLARRLELGPPAAHHRRPRRDRSPRRGEPLVARDVGRFLVT